MTVSLIRYDARVIGVASATPSDQGLGVLAWFRANVSAYSMDHALTHEGYSIDAPGDLDCRDVESIINAVCERAGVTMESVFVPFSQSRNAKPGADGKPWESLNWRVTIKRRGREILTTDYAQGVGYVPNPDKLKKLMSYHRRSQIVEAIEKGSFGRVTSGFRRVKIETPSIGAVMQCLARDCDVLDAAGFDEWACDFGYDPDSRKAESIYREGVENATKLRAGLGVALLSEIRLAASFN